MISPLSVQPPPRLDRYCITTCQERRCDANRDCGMLRFRRQQEVRTRLEEVVTFLAGRHTAIPLDDLVRRFFLSDQWRAILDEPAQRYLERGFGRLLNELLTRDPRFQRVRLSEGTIAWALRGTPAARPDATRMAAPIDLDTARAVETIRQAGRVVALRKFVPGSGEDWSTRAAAEAQLTTHLRTLPGIRCVYIDPHSGLGTYWVDEDWLREQLPRDVQFLPVPAAYFQPQRGDDFEHWDPNAPADETDEKDWSRVYRATVEDVVAGSLILDPQDYRYFPSRPNPVVIELHDEEGHRWDGILLTRGDERELFGLGDFLLDRGGPGLGLRFSGDGRSRRVRVTVLDPVDIEEPNDRPARRVWRTLLAKGNWCTLPDLAAQVGERPDRVQTILEAYRCFEPRGEGDPAWRLDPRQPRLRRRLSSGASTPWTEELLSLLEDLRADLRSLEAMRWELKRDIELLEQRVHVVTGAVQ